MRLETLSGVAALALLATIGTASAFVINPSTSPLLNLGIGNGAGFQNAVNIPPGAPPVPAGVLAGTGIAAINFLGGANGANLSGVYSGSVLNVATSPFGGGNQNYLAAQPGAAGSGVQVVYGTQQTALEILWGTIDTPAGYNSILTTSGNETITGLEVCTALFGAAGCASGTLNREVDITGLNSFNSFTASDTTNLSAFEFVPGTAVPEPTSMAILGAALAGFGVLRRRKTT